MQILDWILGWNLGLSHVDFGVARRVRFRVDAAVDSGMSVISQYYKIVLRNQNVDTMAKQPMSGFSMLPPFSPKYLLNTPTPKYHQ